MASKRCLPTRFFKDADIMNVSKDGQLILVGLVLLADDEGRELAHPRLLSREVDYPPEQIEAALAELVENDLVVLYQAGKHRYYSLTRWNQWQSLSSQKITLSKYPAPPEHAEVAHCSEEVSHAGDSSQNSPIFPREIQGNSGEYREIPSQHYSCTF
jgi:DNA-binding transcriptional ArsR family regulator